jgi:hypothetical protein
MTNHPPDFNPYSPPQAPVADATSLPRIKPITVRRALTSLWVAYGLAFAHAVIVIGDRWLSWPPRYIALVQLGDELFYAVLIGFLASGRYWARLIYAVLLGVRTLNVIRTAAADWHYSQGLLVMTMISFLCQYVAMYWLFTDPGRRWFVGAAAD